MLENYYNNLDDLNKIRRVFSAFLWDDTDHATSSFEYFKSQVEEAAKTEPDIDKWYPSIGELFTSACGFESASCKYGHEIGTFLKKSLRRFGISLKDTKHKDFKPDDDDWCGDNLNSIAVILSEFGISLWSCEGDDMYVLAVSHRKDDQLIADVIDLMGINDIQLISWYAPDIKSEKLSNQEEKIQVAEKSEWELWMEKSRAARNK